MPKISVIIPAYNIEPYIAECLHSVSAQTFKDFEAIVVDDCSTDRTGALADELAAQDSRITVVHHRENQGTHITRKTGAEQASGDYTFFLDGDDALASTMLQSLSDEIDREPTDILHYGLTVVAANDLQDSERQAFDTFNNAPTQPSTGLDIVRDIFDETRGYQVDWRFTQRLYRTELLQQAFSQMTNDRLGRSQDGYECFVISALAQSYRPIKQCNGYIYYYGRGISGTNEISAAKYGKYCSDFKADFDAAYAFARTTGSSEIEACAEGFEHKATEILANDWLVRVGESDKTTAADAMTDVFGSAVTARELYRFVRDRAYEFVSSHTVPEPDDDLYHWMRIAQSLRATEVDTQTQEDRYLAMRGTALGHVNDLDAARKKAAYANQNVRIFVTTHKDADIPQGSVFQPVQVGPGNKTNRFAYSFHDDEGENISNKNPRYCELTTQYWAWKNVDAEYYGFCHYRRYFDFSPVQHTENPYGEVMDDYIDEQAIKRYQLDDQSVQDAVQGYDIITTGIKDLRQTIDQHGTPTELYRAAPYLHMQDLRTVYQIICEQQPEYKADADAFLNGHHSCFCNMYIMRKQQFFDYCEWMFPILEEFERRTDMSLYSKEALRTPGHLSERLFNIWLMHRRRTQPGLKTKELQCVHFTNPEARQEQWPPEVVGKSIVPVAFAADDNYVPMLTTTIYSMLVNASKDRFYDISILQRDISGESQRIMRSFFAQFPNVGLRFIDVRREIAGYSLTTANAHISIETYYRFLIQELLPFYNKVLYLDADLVVNGDVAQLYDTDLGDNLLGAVRDIDYLGNLNFNDGERLAYSKSKLGMTNPYDYFQAGVLLLNTKAMRNRYSMEQWLKFASNPDYIYNDQDVLNACCEGSVCYLDWSWNVMHDCAGRVGNVFTFAPDAMYDAYMASREHPQIIHYAGYQKPWKETDCDFADVYWSYARQTPFYERLLSKASDSASTDIASRIVHDALTHHERAVSENNIVRKFIDPLAPIGSKRRETMKQAVRTMRGRE